MLLGLLLAGCSSSRLEPLLSAPNSQAFDEQLKIHGPIESGEVYQLKQEALGKDQLRARNAAALLTLSRDPSAGESLQGLAATTQDAAIWSTAAASALLREQLGHGAFPAALLRPEMAREGLKSQDPKAYLTAFEIARRLKLPELQTEIPKALKSKDSETQAAAISALSPEQAKGRLAELKAGLKAADYASWPPMAVALIETGDKAAWQAVVDSILHDHEHDSVQSSFVNKVNFDMSPQVYAFMVDRAQRKDEFAPEAYHSLVFQVVQENKQCDRLVMSLALPRLREAARTKVRDDDPEVLVTVVANGGNPSKYIPEWGKRVHGPEALAFAEKWLKEHP